MAPDWSSNCTIQILAHAQKHRYGVLAQVVYDTSSALAVIRAAEYLNSPAMILLFPATLRYHGMPFLRMILELAHSSSAPVAVHLDHATTEDDIELVLSWAEKGVKFDSIMIDASHADTDQENMELVKPYISRAAKLSIPVEVELGRLEGGEAGLRTITTSMLTDPARAEVFMRETGAMVLAPSIGNLHGPYLREPDFRLDILTELNKITNRNNHYLCLHGTDQLEDSLFRSCIEEGCVKININSWSRTPYLTRLSQGIQADEPLPDIMEAATEAFRVSCQRLIKVFGSVGKGGLD